jgi:hypothetical protein
MTPSAHRVKRVRKPTPLRDGCGSAGGEERPGCRLSGLVLQRELMGGSVEGGTGIFGQLGCELPGG